MEFIANIGFATNSVLAAPATQIILWTLTFVFGTVEAGFASCETKKLEYLLRSKSSGLELV